MKVLSRVIACFEDFAAKLQVEILFQHHGRLIRPPTSTYTLPCEILPPKGQINPSGRWRTGRTEGFASPFEHKANIDDCSSCR